MVTGVCVPLLGCRFLVRAPEKFLAFSFKSQSFVECRGEGRRAVVHMKRDSVGHFRKTRLGPARISCASSFGVVEISSTESSFGWASSLPPLLLPPFSCTSRDPMSVWRRRCCCCYCPEGISRHTSRRPPNGG